MAKATRVKGERKRLIVQAAAFLLQNPKLHHFFLGTIETGGTKAVCVPGLNCYSCPAAIGACPVGSLQNAIGGGYKKPAFPFYVLGLIGVMGILSGRFICGWLCLFGLIQELLYMIPTPKLTVPDKADKMLRQLKYAVLAVLVVEVTVAFLLLHDAMKINIINSNQ